MSAKNSDLGRIQEIYDVVTQTKQQMNELSLSKESFLNPKDASSDLISEGILNRVLRVTEEAGHISQDVATAYGFDTHAVLGVRNRLAHAYGEVDRRIIWEVLEHDFDELLEACQKHCDDHGLELS